MRPKMIQPISSPACGSPQEDPFSNMTSMRKARYRLNMVRRRSARYEPFWPVLRAFKEMVRGSRHERHATDTSVASENARRAGRARLEIGLFG